MISDITNFKMPVSRKKFNALEIQNLVTDYNADFRADFLDDIASEIGVCQFRHFPFRVYDDAANHFKILMKKGMQVIMTAQNSIERWGWG